MFTSSRYCRGDQALHDRQHQRWAQQAVAPCAGGPADPALPGWGLGSGGRLPARLLHPQAVDIESHLRGIGLCNPYQPKPFGGQSPVVRIALPVRELCPHPATFVPLPPPIRDQRAERPLRR